MAQCKEVQLLASAFVSEYRVLLWGFRTAGVLQVVPSTSQLSANKDITWKTNKSGSKEREREREKGVLTMSNLSTVIQMH